MKLLRILLPIVLGALSTMALAQSDAQKSFDKMKSLAGTWIGPVEVNPPMHDEKGSDKPVRVTLRVTSRGNALVHEMSEDGSPDDPTKTDHPVTMFYVDNDHLNLIHYCDAGNRPHMAGKISPDGKKVEFDFIDVTGNLQYGHMEHAVFTIIDDNHHSEDWTFLMPGDKPMHAHMDLQRAK
jgi:hypothetical protein